ncbi:MAG TPA: hypothetical protein PLI09_09070 [Candidatus Hydrogenedentes bacterium]|nr:hypothetical protein [Candidatus Hydrogenedentota bacterium]
MSNMRIHGLAGRIPAKASSFKNDIDIAFDIMDLFFWVIDLINAFLDFMRNLGDYLSGE